MKDTITKLYPSLTGQERFQLALRATADGNNEERERLVRTCPKKNYTMNEAAFIDRIEAAETLTLAFSLDLAERHGRLQLVVAVQKFLPHIVEKLMLQGYLGMDRCYESGWLAAGGKGPPPDMEENEYLLFDKEIQPLVLIRRALQEQVKALWEAFSEVSRNDMGLEPEVPLAAFCPPILEWLKDDIAGEIDADEAVKSKNIVLMRDYWQKRVGE
jgi:hypothetical protein